MKYFWAVLFTLTFAATAFGQDVESTVEPMPVAVVTQEVVPDTVVVEDGGTVVINPEAPAEVPESDVSVIAKVAAVAGTILVALRMILAAMLKAMTAASQNTMVMSGGEWVAGKLPQPLKDQAAGAVEDARKVTELAKSMLAEMLDDDPYLLKKIADKSKDQSKPEFPPPSTPAGL